MSVSRRRKYDDEFRRQAVARMADCTSISGLARELGIRRKWLYKWKKQFAAGVARTTAAVPAPLPDEPPVSPSAALVAELQQKVEQLEQLSGRRALELDFFRKALPRVNALRRTRSSGALACTAKSAPTSSGKARTD